MAAIQTVLVTGAAGNLGRKLCESLQGRYALRLLDRAPGGLDGILTADLSRWDMGWVDSFTGVDAVVHLAADPTAQQTWDNLIPPNMDALVNVFLAAARAKVRRLVYASSNHVLGGYMHREMPATLTPETSPLPGCRYVVAGEPRDSTPYGAAKLFGERLGRALAETHGMEVVAVRLGWVLPGVNRARNIPPERDAWFRLMWLSDRDYLHLMDRCLGSELPERFVIVNGMSSNTGMRWDLASGRRSIGFCPQDDVTRDD